MRLLIVDDHAAMRRLLGRVVADLFSAVEECEDGSDALAAYERHRPDWVFMDIEMSRTDGITATREILLAFPDAKVVIVSKHDDEQLRAAAPLPSRGQRFANNHQRCSHAVLRKSARESEGEGNDDKSYSEVFKAVCWRGDASSHAGAVSSGLRGRSRARSNQGLRGESV